MPVEPGRIFVLSGPSGSGKSSVIAGALAPGDLPARLSVSATTRKPRRGEVDGIHYHFWTLQRFEEAVRAGEFLEWAEVFGMRYGTLLAEVDPYLPQGISVILDIDIQGAARVKAQRPEALMVFLQVSLEECERRLRRRGTETETEIQQRLARTQAELAHASEYDVRILNDELPHAVASLRALIQSRGGSQRA